MNRKGFTLVELLMVVIIIGILVTLAVPSYYKSIERTKGSKVKAALRTITNAQVQYRALHDTYVETASVADLAEVDLPASLITLDDGDWTYDIVAPLNGDAMDITATRIAGPYSGEEVTMDQDGYYDNGLGVGPSEWN